VLVEGVVADAVFAVVGLVADAVFVVEALVAGTAFVSVLGAADGAAVEPVTRLGAELPEAEPVTRLGAEPPEEEPLTRLGAEPPEAEPLTTVGAALTDGAEGAGCDVSGVADDACDGLCWPTVR
jgi:hypothetical protein